MHLAKTYTIGNAQKSKYEAENIYKYHKCIKQKLAQLQNASKTRVKSNIHWMFRERYLFVWQHIVLDGNISQLGVESFFRNVIYYHWSGDIIGFNSAYVT